MVAGRAEPALTQIRLSTLQGLHERVTHLTLGQTRRLLGGTVAPVGACSSHRNPRRGGRGRVRGPLHLERLRAPYRPKRSPLSVGQGNGYPLLLQPMVMVGGSEEVVKLPKLHREEGSIVSLQNWPTFTCSRPLRLPVSREYRIVLITDPSTCTHHP